MSWPEPSPDPIIADEAPTEPVPTDYDFTMLICYLRLLDAETAQADWREIAQHILKIDPDGEPERALHMCQTHLTRAHWMAELGFRHLLKRCDAAN